MECSPLCVLIHAEIFSEVNGASQKILKGPHEIILILGGAHPAHLGTLNISKLNTFFFKLKQKFK
jgi:hypothetical protein